MQVAGLEYCPNHGEYHCIVSDHVIDLYRAFRDQLIWTTCSVYHMSLQFMDQNRLRNTVSCHFRLAGVSGHTGRDSSIPPNMGERCFSKIYRATFTLYLYLRH